MAIVYEVVANVGKYTNKNGEEKTIFRKVGLVNKNDKGNMYLLLDKTFNPAGLAEAGRENIILSLFPPKDKEDEQDHSKGKFAETARKLSANELDDIVPF